MERSKNVFNVWDIVVNLQTTFKTFQCVKPLTFCKKRAVRLTIIKFAEKIEI